MNGGPSTLLISASALAARSIHLKFGVMARGLDRRRSATTCVPEGKHLNLLTADPVVKIVVNSRQMDAPHALRLGVHCRGTNSRLCYQKREGLREFFVQRARRKGTILLPPNGGLFNMRIGTLGEPNSHGLISRDDGQASLTPPLQKLSRHARPQR